MAITDESLNARESRPRDEASDLIGKMKKEAQDEEAVRLSPESGIGGKFTAPKGMTPEQHQKWESSLGKQQHFAEVARGAPKEKDIYGPGMGQVAAEIGAGFTPAGWAIDAKDIGVAMADKDVIGLAMAGVGLFPGFGDAGKAALKAIRRGDRSAETMAAAKKVLGEKQAPLGQWMNEADLRAGDLDLPLRRERAAGSFPPTDKKQAQLLEGWMEELDAGKRTLPPDDLAPEVSKTVWTLRPDLAPESTVKFTDLMATAKQRNLAQAKEAALHGPAGPVKTITPKK
mgnify:FL=1